WKDTKINSTAPCLAISSVTVMSASKVNDNVEVVQFWKLELLGAQRSLILQASNAK
ncbi:hypothetical protein LOAG_11668, partial [Loa loa]